MLIRINNAPLEVDSFAQTYIEASNELTKVITQSINVELSVGGSHLISADMNPINAPHYIIKAINHLVDWIF
ncbi:hypothetical protein BC351_00435 [Paenibacillus ferrarius]|uniref:Uncharacterized protein n=1 Tax=Paenibacillus ferrarius TaxID=1469647 RepID=A0A1V4HTB5_9BACL|nr:hypothetical protein [Paenibacillus ferrarius]OPH61743.1 hypothetical protein BC351_00435 [Paenibacillus ferrarius]